MCEVRKSELKEDNHQNLPSFFNLRNRISFKNLKEQKKPHQKILRFDEVMACQSSPFSALPKTN